MITQKKFVLFLLMIFAHLIYSCNKPAFKTKWLNNKAPETFIARFVTTKGNFDVQITRNFSPLAADRFYQLIKHHYYKNAIFYRAVPNFVIQFGNTDSAVQKKWESFKFVDEPVLLGNKKGNISFARGGKETRSTELFINLKDNPRLDTINYNGVKGFPCFGNVINGAEVIDSIYKGYGEKPMRKFDSMYINRKNFLQNFPNLDLIKKTYIIKSAQ